ncbi:MAG: FkbM family methyltransferase [Nanoarchaeota archaeon]|nr:FkbM family methyltransferase [Nanoarchaeota archaeon]
MKHNKKNRNGISIKNKPKNYSKHIKNLLKLLLNSVGHIAGHSPIVVKKFLALISQSVAFNDTLSRWNYLLMEEIFHNVNEPVIVTKNRFKVFESSIGHNMRLDLSNDLQRAYYFLNYGQDLLEIMKQSLKKDSVFIDVGANIGYFTMLASSIIKRGRIIAFEPSSVNYEILLNNTKNSIVEAHKTALSDKNGSARLYIDKKSTGWHSLIGSGQYENVKASRFDDLDFGLKKIDLIKIDVERHEFDVLKGMKKSLLKYGPKVVCEVNSNSEKKVLNFMSNLGYKSKRFEGANTYDVLFEKV